MKNKENLSEEEKLIKLKTDFLLDNPFFATNLLRLNIYIDETGEKVPPFAYASTDGEDLIFHKRAFNALPYPQLISFIAHEVLHNVCCHPLLIGDRDPIICNIAMDYVVNQILKDAGFELPKGALINEKYYEWEWQAIYLDLLKDQKNLTQLLQQIKKAEENGNGESPCSGWVFRQKRKDGSQLSEAERKMKEREQKVLNEQASKIHEKQCGNLPGFLQRLLKKLQEPKINWKDALAQFVSVAARSDYTWTMPNKKYVYRDLYLPRIYKPELGEIVNLVDASGSISQEELDAELNELRGQLYAFENLKILLILFDTEATEPMEITDSSEIKNATFKNLGGGTDYKPAFKKIEEAGIDPICVIVLTDGYCDSFPKEPSYPVLWVLTHKNKYWNPPFGQTTIMDLEAEK